MPVLLWTENVNRTEYFNLLLHMYFCISGVMAGVTSAKVLESNKMKYTSNPTYADNPNQIYASYAILSVYDIFLLSRACNDSGCGTL